MKRKMLPSKSTFQRHKRGKTGGVSEFSQSGIILNDVMILFTLKVL